MSTTDDEKTLVGGNAEKVLTAERVAAMEAGRELDVLVCTLFEPEPRSSGDSDRAVPVFEVLETSGRLWWFTRYPHDEEPRWHPRRVSSWIGDAWLVVEKMAPLVGPFGNADGVLSLTFGADYTGEDCEAVGVETEESNYWTAHLHLRHVGADSACPKHWRHGDAFCAFADTAPLAICRAALLAMLSRPGVADP